MAVNVEKVFDAGGYPEYTYVERERKGFQDNIRAVLRRSTSGATIVGPSKSGKSILLERFDNKSEYEVMKLRGANIGSVDQLWGKISKRLGLAETREEFQSETDEGGHSVNGSIGASGTKIGGSINSKDQHVEGQRKHYQSDKFHEIVNHDQISNYIIFIDDYQYINESVRKDIGQALKGALEEGVNIFISVTPHRKEVWQRDVPNVDERVMTIECDQWRDDELAEILSKGEKKLNVQFPEWIKPRLKENAIQSPMLMQELCAAVCRVSGVTEARDPILRPKKLDIDESDYGEVLSSASRWIGKSQVVDSILSGKYSSGTSEFNYGDDSSGDIYELGLMAIAEGDTSRSFDFEYLYSWVRENCTGDYPETNQMRNFCESAEEIAQEESPNEELIEWDKDKDVFVVSDPNLLFEIRYRFAER